MSATTLLFSLLGGVLPALLWLWFWLKEDRLHPEPRALIIASFISGMVAVLPALWLEQVISEYSSVLWLTLLGWAAAEEALKYAAAHISALRRSDNDEPIDSLMYLITSALGFAALENALFLAGGLKGGSFLQGIDLGVLRFIGASLLHVISSGTVGFFLALGFYKRRFVKDIDWMIGLAAAVALHFLFNLYILKGDGNGGYTFSVFAVLWLFVILLLVGFEKVKQIREG